MSNLTDFKKKIVLALACASIFGDKTSGKEGINAEKTLNELPVSKNQPKKLTNFEDTKSLRNYLIAGGLTLGLGALILGTIKFADYFTNKNNDEQNNLKKLTDNDKRDNLKKLTGVEDNDEINKNDILSDDLLKRYLESPVIPKSIIAISSNIQGGVYFNDFGEATYKNYKLATYHSFPYDPNKGSEKRTELEKDIDKLVDDGFMHLKYTTHKQVDDLINNLEPVKMEPARFYGVEKCDGNDIPGTDFFKYKSAENSMVVVCSQYNALESWDDVFSSLPNWLGDPTQGPRASLSAHLYAMLRISSYLKNKLNDAIDNVLGKELMNLDVGGGHKLYQHGYLNLTRALSSKSFSRDNWKALADTVTNNIRNFKLNFQWVLCNDGTPMIQVFAAAPCMQYMRENNKEWWQGENAEKVELIKKLCNPICEAIQVHQMKMIGKLAKLRRMVSGKSFALHAWLPGGRSFANHPDVLQAAAEALIEEVQNVDIDVYFHNRTPGNPLKKALEAKGVKFEAIKSLELK